MADNEDRNNVPIDGEDDQTAKIPRPPKPTGSKVVLNSGTDSAIRPSDATRMAPSPLAGGGGESNVVPAPPPAASSDGEDDQTTKIPSLKKPPKPGGVQLKPISPPSANGDESMEETVEMDRNEVAIDPSVSIKKDDAAPLPKKGDDDKTSKVPMMKSPQAAAPKPPPSVSLKPASEPKKEEEDVSKEETVDMDKNDVVPVKPKSGDDDKTSKVPTVKPPQAAAPPAPPKADAPKEEEKKEEKAPAAAEAKPADGEKSEESPKKSKTIKLKPLDISEEDDVEETLSMDRSSLMDGSVPSIAGGGGKKDEAKAEDKKQPGVDDEATIKIEKPVPKKPAHPTPSVPGAKETIKLRPSGATPPPPAEGAAKPAAASTIKVKPTPPPDKGGEVSKNTIRLVPKKKDGGAASSAKPVKPSDPTVKLDEASEDVTQKVKPSAAQTVKLPDESGDAASSKKTLKLKPKGGPAAPPLAGDGSSPAPPPAATTDATEAEMEGMVPDKSANPGIVMTLVACAVFFLLIYLGLLIGGQWAHNEIDKDFDYQFIFMKDVVKKPM